MATRRFTGDLPPDPGTDDLSNGRQPPIQPAPALPSRPAVPAQPRGAAPQRPSAHLPRTLTQVLNEANERVIQGDLVDYVPMSTGFDPLDGFIGGGLRKTELTLL